MIRRAAALGAALALPLAAQETPHPNRLAWFQIFPEPLPEGRTQIALEATNQFLRGDRTDSDLGPTHAELQGEDWQLTADFARPLAGGFFNLRARLVHRSEGIASQAIVNWHDIIGVEQGGRESTVTFKEVYRLQWADRTIFELTRPELQLQGLDLAYVRPWGNGRNGGRIGASVQVPTGGRETLRSSGGVNFTAGVAAWRTFGSVRAWAQVESVWIQQPRSSPLRLVLDQGAFARAWAGLDMQGPGGGFWREFGLDLSLGWVDSPYRTGLVRIDKFGMQQTWVFRHARLPRWRFGFTEKAGTFTTPEITGFVVFRP